jgi:hypothetical protein
LFFILSLSEVFVASLFFWFYFFHFSFVFVGVLSFVSVELWKRTQTTKRGGERQRGRTSQGATKRGEFLATQPSQTRDNSRGLLPSL